MRKYTAQRLFASAGFTLVELMIAITLGLFVIGGLVLLFLTSSRSGREITESNRQIEDGQFALKTLTWSLDHAGYLSFFNPVELPTPAALPNPCATTEADLSAALPIHIQGYDDGINYPGCLNPPARTDSDVVVLRRASVCSSTADCLAPGGPYFQASACGNNLELASGDVTKFFRLSYSSGAATMDRHLRNCVTLAPVRRLVVQAFYVADHEYYPGQVVPTLMRADLGPGGFTSTPVAPNIESMQLEYGIDSDGDGVPDIFTADPTKAIIPGTASACDATTSQCADVWRNVVAAKTFLLARNKKPLSGPSVAKTFSLGLDADGAPFELTTAADGYKRSVYQTVARLNNPSMRREQ